MTVQATQALVDFVTQLVRDPNLAFQFASNGSGVLAAQGITEHDLSGVDMTQVVAEACQTPGFPPEAAGALQGYYSGGGSNGGGGGGGYTQPAPAPNPADHVVQQLQYVNYVTHEGDTTIQQTIIDQSTSFDVDGDFSGSVDIDNAAANGDGAIAGGEGDINAATGAGAQVIDDSQVGQNQNNSDGAVQVGEDNNAPIVTGTNTGVVADGDIEAPVNTGVNSGVLADGDVDDTVVGDGNQTANVDGIVDGTINFGDGDVTNLPNSSVNNSNFGEGDNVGGNTLNDGSAIGTGAGATSASSDDTTISESNTVHAEDSIVNTEQGPGDQNVLADNDANEGFLPPSRLTEEEPQPLERQLEQEDAPGVG
jgi:hypothetical protein